MTTVSDVIDDVELTLAPFADRRGKETHLTAAVDAVATELTVHSGQIVDRGFVEIDHELIRVQSVDTSTGLLTCGPTGRGRYGTTPAAHSIGARVTVNPAFPRHRIFRELNAAISALTDLFEIRQLNNVTHDGRTLSIPADVIDIAQVRWYPDGVTDESRGQDVDRYRIRQDPEAGVQRVELVRCIPETARVALVAALPLRPLASPESPLSSAGLRDEWADIIRMRACAVLVQTLDISRVRLEAMEAGARAENVPPMSATQISKAFMAQFQARRQDSRLELAKEFRQRIRMTY